MFLVFTKLLVKNLDEWGKAVGCARSIADDGLIWFVSIRIDTNNVGWDVTLAGGCNKYFLGTSLNVLARTLSVYKHSCPFNHKVDAQVPESPYSHLKSNNIKIKKCSFKSNNIKSVLSIEINDLPPGEIDGVAVRNNLDDLAINRDAISTNWFNIGFKDAEGGVVLEEVRGLLDTSGVIDGNDFKWRVLAAVPAPQEVPTNSTKPIDCNLQLCLSSNLPVPAAAAS